MKPQTADGIRHFTCKMCGTKNAEPIRAWKKKPQKDKNVCQQCLEKRAATAQTARERAYLYGHKY